jgi:hypothetical protein
MHSSQSNTKELKRYSCAILLIRQSNTNGEIHLFKSPTNLLMPRLPGLIELAAMSPSSPPALDESTRVMDPDAELATNTDGAVLQDEPVPERLVCACNCNHGEERLISPSDGEIQQLAKGPKKTYRRD